MARWAAVAASVTVVAVSAGCGILDREDSAPTGVGDGLQQVSIASAPSATVTETTQSAPIVINTAGVERLINASSVRKWANDVERGDTATLTAKCWTMPPSYIRDQYIGPGTARLSALLSQAPKPTQAGVLWGDNAANVFVTWAEGKSDYACPKVDPVGNGRVSDDYVAYRVKRYILRAQGRPVNPGDEERSYSLECDILPGVKNNVAHANPNSIVVTNTGGNNWRVTAGAVTFQVSHEPSEPCIKSAG